MVPPPGPEFSQFVTCCWFNQSEASNQPGHLLGSRCLAGRSERSADTLFFWSIDKVRKNLEPEDSAVDTSWRCRFAGADVAADVAADAVVGAVAVATAGISV